MGFRYSEIDLVVIWFLGNVESLQAPFDWGRHYKTFFFIAMRDFMSKLMSLVVLGCCFWGNAASAAFFTVTGKVTRIVTFATSYATYSENSRGLTGIYVEGLPEGCGAGTQRVLIGVDHPNYQTVLSLALTAHSTGKKVSISYVDACTLRAGSWDFAYITLESE